MNQVGRFRITRAMTNYKFISLLPPDSTPCARQAKRIKANADTTMNKTLSYKEDSSCSLVDELCWYLSGLRGLQCHICTRTGHGVLTCVAFCLFSHVYVVNAAR